MLMPSTEKYDMPPEEAFFWERLSGMPWREAEQELVIRREGQVLEMNMLKGEADWCKKKGDHAEAKRIGNEVLKIMSTLTVINERLKYIRKLQDSINMQKAVLALYGQEVFNECKRWIAASECSHVRQDH